MDYLKKYFVVILCATLIVMMALPVVGVYSKRMFEIGSTGNVKKYGTDEVSLSGFDLLEFDSFGYFLLLLPALHILFEFIKSLQKYKKISSILIPILSIISLVVVLINSKNIGPSGQMGGIKIGAVLIFIVNIFLAVYGAVLNFGFSLNNRRLNKVKENASKLIKGVQNGVQGNLVKNTSNVQPNVENAITKNDPAMNAKFQNQSQQPQVVRPVVACSADGVSSSGVNISRAEEILALIEKLSKMKDAGILTE